MLGDLANFPARITVEHSKLVTYLLNREHTDGRSKAEFFGRFGYDLTNVTELGMALAQHAFEHAPGVERITPKGFVNIACTGPIKTPDGRNPSIKSVWVVGPPDEMTFVTAYPSR